MTSNVNGMFEVDWDFYDVALRKQRQPKTNAGKTNVRDLCKTGVSRENDVQKKCRLTLTIEFCDAYVEKT